MILERVAGERFSRVLPLWLDYPVVLLAGGPSLTPDQFALVGEARKADRVRVISINDSYLCSPWSDVNYAADAKWHRWHTEGIDKPALGLKATQVRELWRAFPGERCSVYTSDAVADERVHLLRNAHHPYLGNGLSLDPGILVTGRHSGFQAFNLAVLAGAKRVILLGFDGQPARDGKTHWFGEHPKPTGPGIFKHIRQSFSAVEREIEAAGVKVVNCSPGTAINSFPKASLEETLGAIP